MSKLHRRTMLRGAGGIAIGLPWLEIMGCSRAPEEKVGRVAQQATAQAFPKRFVAVYTPNGNVLESWKPSGTETLALSPILAPLEAHKANLLIVDGLRLLASKDGPGDPHQRGMAWLTAQQLTPGDQVGNDGVSRAGFADGISVDQKIASVIGASTKFRSLEFGVQLGGADVMHRISYLGSGQPLPPEESPQAAFDRVFANIAEGSGDAGAALKRHRATVLDAVAGDYDRLKKRLGADDRRKVEAHVTSIREVEMRLNQGIIVSDTCSPTAPAKGIDLANQDNFPLIGKLQMDILAMSLACDLTRVASLQWSGARNKHTFNWLDIGDEHHTLSHSGSSDDESQGKLAKVHTWYSQQFAYLLGRLKSIPEGDGTVLDSTAILWGTDVAVGNVHSDAPMPFVLAGGAQKAFRTGRYVAFPEGTSHSNLLVSLINAMGIPAQTFGKPGACTGPLSGLG
ncbi:MAG TPA: DUF1552 domain-containing protein [Polyangiaceae bacterium]|nr:DUF1552 domain-containing protein [Polyangiaceae bacterium]